MYGRPYRPQGGGDNIQRFFHRGGTPLTITVLALYVILFFVIFGLPQLNLGGLLAFSTQDWPSHFWSVLTWPLVGHGDPLSVLFAIGWFYLFAGSMERSWGTRDFGAFLAVTVVLTACTVWLASFALGPGIVAGLWVAAGPVAVAWSRVNRGEQVGIFFISVPAPIVGILAAAMVWFYAGAANGQPLLGLFALSGCAAAWWYVTQGRYATRGYTSRRAADPGFAASNRRGRGADVTPETASRFYRFDRETVEPGRRGFNLIRWWRDRQERKRLEEIFRRSGYTDKDE